MSASMSATAASAPTAVAASPDPFVALQPWIRERCGLGDDVRDESYRCALSAVVHRVLKFGHEEALNHLSARDCMNCCLMCGGHAAELFLRTAFTRALIEDDRMIVDRVLATPFIPESRLWLAKLMAALQGDEVAMKDGAAWLESMDGEERALASLVIGRVYPQLAEIEWLHACPTTYPRLAAEIALLLLRLPERKSAVLAYLRAHPAVKFAVDDERWP